MEWYDVGVFGYLIITLGPIFLPEASRESQVLFMLGTFAATYVFRPLGGVFFGWLGDRIGRQRTLFITLSVVVCATFTIGLLPTYQSIGLLAPILLISLKIIQGFTAGGELTGALTFVCEHAPDKKRGFFAAFLDGGSYLGFVAGALVVTGLQVAYGQQAMLDGLWRVPFLIAGPVGLIAIYIRMKVVETPAFEVLTKEQENQDAPLRRLNPFQIVRDNWRPMLQVLALAAAANAAGYVFTSYMPTYLAGMQGLNEVSSNLVSIPVLLVMAFSMPLIGKLSDRIGRKPVLWIAAVWIILLGVPAFALLNAGTIPSVMFALVLIGVPVACYQGSLAAALPALFPTSQRSSGLGISYNLASSIFGGTAPLIIEWFSQSTGNHLAGAFYLAILSLGATIAIKTMRETARRPLLGSPASVETKEEAAEILAAVSKQRAPHSPAL
ncbi:MFS transporter [Paeniglutamicibacter sp. R2-26]|uniref:MFS transporter n=1 Tax=Paeniglutamicibacter sp. R2-26 TaxID=3144417 RepID=UPI003EE62024